MRRAFWLSVYLSLTFRGYQQDTPVNKQIRASLEDRYSLTNFWTLNNGITIISTGVGSAGHLALNVSDPQIVNGLQTSREIFNHFNRPHANGGDDIGDNDPRSVLVRVLIITDEAAQDAVIRATNSQNQLAPSSFRMTDQIHRDIEGLFKSYDLYYDRRKGSIKTKGDR
jgi:AIPR protein